MPDYEESTIDKDSDDSAEHDYDTIEAEIKKIDKEKTENNDIPLLVCPHCGEPRLTYYRMSSGGIFGGLTADQHYICNNCGYIGSVAVEIESVDDIEKIKANYEQERLTNPPDEVFPLTPGYSWLWRTVFYMDIFVLASPFICSFIGIRPVLFDFLKDTRLFEFIFAAILFFAAFMIKKSDR